MTSNLNSRLARLKAKRGVNQEQLFFRLADWAPDCPQAFQPWEDEELFPLFRAIALDNLIEAGRIRESDRDRVTFIVHRIVYPPEREGEDERYRRVRPMLREWEARQAAGAAQGGTE
jgi:hypothetical protein